MANFFYQPQHMVNERYVILKHKKRRVINVGKTKIVCLGLVCLLFLISGCVDTSMMYRGNHIRSVPVVTLQEGGAYANTWQTFALLVDYSYVHTGDVFEISGQLELSDHYKINYGNIREMYVYLFFLDESSRVLETVALPKTWSGSTTETQEFSKSLQVPSGTTGFSFGYSGAVRIYK